MRFDKNKNCKDMKIAEENGDSFNLVWDVDVSVDNDIRSYLLGKPIYDMHCNSCMSFIGAYNKPEDCTDKFCSKCGHPIINQPQTVKP